MYLPSTRQQVNFNEWIRVAVIVPGCQIPRLKNMDDEIAQLFVVIYLKLQNWKKMVVLLSTSVKVNEYGIITFCWLISRVLTSEFTRLCQIVIFL